MEEVGEVFQEWRKEGYPPGEERSKNEVWFQGGEKDWISKRPTPVQKKVWLKKRNMGKGAAEKGGGW